MTRRMTATALAAGLIALCSATGLRAAPFTITSNSETNGDGNIGFSLSGTTGSGPGFSLPGITGGHVSAFHYAEDILEANSSDFAGMSVSDPSATYATSNFTTTTDSLGITTNSLDFEVSNPQLAWMTSDSNGPVQKYKGYDFTFTLFQLVAPNDQVFLYQSSSTMTILGSSYDLLGSTLVSSVPLPASAPLFGAGLAALAVLGVGVRRRSAAKAI